MHRLPRVGRLLTCARGAAAAAAVAAAVASAAVTAAVPGSFEEETGSSIVYHQLCSGSFFWLPLLPQNVVPLRGWGRSFDTTLGFFKVPHVSLKSSWCRKWRAHSWSNIYGGGQNTYFFLILTISDILKMTGEQNICICIWFACLSSSNRQKLSK